MPEDDRPPSSTLLDIFRDPRMYAPACLVAIGFVYLLYLNADYAIDTKKLEKLMTQTAIALTTSPTPGSANSENNAASASWFAGVKDFFTSDQTPPTPTITPLWGIKLDPNAEPRPDYGATLAAQGTPPANWSTNNSETNPNSGACQASPAIQAKEASGASCWLVCESPSHTMLSALEMADLNVNTSITIHIGSSETTLNASPYAVISTVGNQIYQEQDGLCLGN